MAKNRYGVRLDSNGYAPSIIHDGDCFICHFDGDVVRHEIYPGVQRRDTCKRLGYWITLCPTCHQLVHDYPEKYKWIKTKTQEIAFEHYPNLSKYWLKEIHKNYV